MSTRNEIWRVFAEAAVVAAVGLGANYVDRELAHRQEKRHEKRRRRRSRRMRNVEQAVKHPEVRGMTS